MDSFPEELLEPPLSPILITGCPKLHPQLEAFFSKTLRPALRVLKHEDQDINSFYKSEDVEKIKSEGSLPGMVDIEWMKTLRTGFPAVIVVFIPRFEPGSLTVPESSSCRSDVDSDPNHWEEIMAKLESVKECCTDHEATCVVVFVSEEMKEVSMDLMITLHQRFGVEEDLILSLLVVNVDPNDPFVMQLANNELKTIGQVILGKAWQFHREHGEKISHRVSERWNGAPQWKVLDYFKLGYLEEFQQNWTAAVQQYDVAYRYLLELLKNGQRHLKGKLILEILCVSEVITTKMCTLLMHQQRPEDAWKQFQTHLSKFRTPIGVMKNGLLAFFFGWLSRQYEIILDIVNQRTGTHQSLLSVSIVSRRHIANLYFCASEAAVLERHHVQKTLKQLSSDKLPVYDFVVPSRFWGQYQLKSDDTFKPVPDPVLDDFLFAMESSTDLQQRSIRLLTACLSNLKHSKITRKAARVSALLAEEQLASGEVHAARENLLRVADIYRRDGWSFPLSAALRLLIEISAESFWERAVYSLELSTLEAVADIGERSSFARSGIEILIAQRSEIAQSKLWESDAGEIEKLSRDDRVKGDLKDNGWSSVVEAICGFELVRDGNDILQFGVAVKSNLPVPLPLQSMTVHFIQHRGQSRVIKIDEAESIDLKTGQWREFTAGFVPTVHGEIRMDFIELFFGTHASLAWHLRLSNQTTADQEIRNDQMGHHPPFKNSPICAGLHSVRVKHIGASPSLSMVGPEDVYLGERISVMVEISCEADFKGESLRLDMSCDNSMGNPQWEGTGTSVREVTDVKVTDSAPWKKDQSITVYSFGMVTLRAALKLNSETTITQVLSFEVKEPFSVETRVLSPAATYLFLPSPYESKPDPLTSEHPVSKPIATNTVCLAEDTDTFIKVAIKCKAECGLILTEATYLTEVDSIKVTPISGKAKDVACTKGDVYTAIYRITPKTPVLTAVTSSLSLKWKRKAFTPRRQIAGSLPELIAAEVQPGCTSVEAMTTCRLHSLKTQKPLLTARCQPPGPVFTGEPFHYTVHLNNATTLPEEFDLLVTDVPGCLFSGDRAGQITIAPTAEQRIRWECVAYTAGNIRLPKIRITSPRLKCFVDMEGMVVFAQPTPLM